MNETSFCSAEMSLNLLQGMHHKLLKFCVTETSQSMSFTS